MVSKSATIATRVPNANMTTEYGRTWSNLEHMYKMIDPAVNAKKTNKMLTTADEAIRVIELIGNRF